MSDSVRILGVRVDSLTLPEAADRIEEYIATEGSKIVVTANPEIIMLALKDAEFSAIMADAEMVTADGIGLVIGARILGTPLPARVTGIDLSQEIFRRATQRGWKIFLLGAAPGIAEEAAQNLCQKYKGLEIVGTHHGFFKPEDEEEIIHQVQLSRPDILLVALGMGRQEKWVWKNRHRLQVPVNIGVGGSLDVYAGRVKRAPLWMQKLGLEWLHRLILQPWRFLRMLVLPKFLLQVIFDKARRD